MESVHASFEVNGGLFPGKPEEQYRKQFHILSGDWHSPDREAVKNRVWDEASAYMKELSYSGMNWTRMDWIEY